jgi:hypothetical protein
VRPPGKRVGGRIYLHRSAVRARPDLAPAIERAQLVVGHWPWDVARVGRGEVALVQSPDFDSAAEPTVGEMLVVDLGTGDVRHRPARDELYHHKHLMVADGYQGFDVAESRARSAAWGSLRGVDRRRIGRRDYWEEHVVPRLNPPRGPSACWL